MRTFLFSTQWCAFISEKKKKKKNQWCKSVTAKKILKKEKKEALLILSAIL